jgi:hypothetical protein
VASTARFSQVLWSLTLAWLAGCGRVGFDPFGDDVGALPDAAVQDAPPDAAPIGAVVKVTVPAMTTECGNAASGYQLTIANPGDQPLVIAKLTPKQNVIVAIQATATVVVTNVSFTVQSGPLPLTVLPGASTMLGVVPPGAVVGTDIGGTTKTGSFTLETDTGAISQVDLAATVVGANITITTPATTTIDMMSSTGACPSQSVTIGYSGNATAQVTVQVSSGLGLMGFTSGVVAQAKTTRVRPITSLQCSASGMTMQYQVSGIVCQTPAVLDVSYEITGTSTCSCS